MFRLKFYILGHVVYFCREKPANRYGFVEKVVDGMFVQINSVIISFKFQAFLATFQMSRLFIQSTNPKWEADDLRNTRVKDETRGEVLTFKEITWSTLRIDANALYDVRKYPLFIFLYNESYLYYHILFQRAAIRSEDINKCCLQMGFTSPKQPCGTHIN